MANARKNKSSGSNQLPPPVYCLFHKTYDCLCIHPVTDKETLEKRIEHQRRLDELKKKYKL